MSIIIDSTYFTQGTLFIPNLDDINVSPTGSPDATSDINFYIEEYEREVLMNALGITLYEELVTASADLSSADSKWQNLVEGETYTDPDDVVKRWEGLQGYNQQSLVACYVYTQYLRDYIETFTTAGVVKIEAEGAKIFGATPKLVRAWNKFLKQYQDDASVEPVIYANQFGSVGVDWLASQRATVSLWQYLNDQNSLTDDEAFPDFTFKFYHPINTIGI